MSEGSPSRAVFSSILVVAGRSSSSIRMNSAVRLGDSLRPPDGNP